MADFKHRRDRGIVRFSGELNHAAAVDLVETVDLLTRVYFYDLIEIQISSLGGVSTALEHYLAAHERWRAAGVRVRTRVVDRAASAAALLLSLGDERIAEPGAGLVYHFFRVCSDAPVTATAAAVLFSDLADLDDRFLARLVDRAFADAGGVVTIAPAVDASDLPVLDRLTAALPAGAKPRPRTARGLARLLERAVRGAIRAKDRKVLAAIYKTLCRSEVAVSPAVACLLRLIDHVGDPPASPARAASAPGLVVPEWRLLYPDAGAVPREVLTRHTLALGDTGSGKTLSVVLPVLLAALRAPRGRFAGGLVVDPKGELAPVLAHASPQRVRVLAPSQTGLNLMSGPAWSLAPQLAAGRYREAAHRIVLRALSLEPALSTRVLLDHQAPGHTTNAEFWDREGSALLVDVIAVVLMLTDAGAPAPEAWCADAEPECAWVRALLDRARGVGAERGHNVLALAAYALDTAFAVRPAGLDLDSPFGPDMPDWRFGRVVRAAASVWGRAPGEARDVVERVLSYWMEHALGRALFTTLVASARAACGAIADTAATSLYFGCEPGAAGADALAEDLACAVRTDAPGPLLVYQPSRSGHDTLVGKAVKGLFFEVVFNDPDRARGAPDAPLVVYAADEFHRFATTDWATGDPAFVDACRSRSVFCVLACQSLASVEHALSHRGGSDRQDRAGLSVVWNNTGSKYVFRSTDPLTSARVEDACPASPGLARLIALRPLASLAPGECYAALADGRFERRQLDPALPAVPERIAPRRRSSRRRPSRDARARARTDT